MVQVGRWHSTLVRKKQVEKPGRDQDDNASKKVGEWPSTWRSVQCTYSFHAELGYERSGKAYQGSSSLVKFDMPKNGGMELYVKYPYGSGDWSRAVKSNGRDGVD